MSRLLCLQLLLLLLLFVCAVQPDNLVNRSCAKNGQYCQTHRECCSGKCMTYSYKCAPKVPEDLVPSQIPVDSPQPDWWSQYFNRKPLPAYVTDGPVRPDPQANQFIIYYIPSQVPTNPTATCKSIGQYCSDSRDCCSQRCHTYLRKCVT